MINQLNVDVSLPVEVNVKPEVLCAVIETCPGVPPVVALLNRMIEEAVQAVVATAIVPGVPAIAAETPTEALDPAVITSLLPAVPRTKFPFVAVILPNVAVSVVVAATEPGATTEAGRLKVTGPVEGVAVI